MLRKNPTGVQTKDLGFRPKTEQKRTRLYLSAFGRGVETQLLISKMGEPLLTSGHCVEIFMEIPPSTLNEPSWPDEWGVLFFVGQGKRRPF